MQEVGHDREEDVIRGYGFGERNESGEKLVD